MPGEVSVTVGQPPMGHYVREGYFENDPEHRMWAKDECQLWFPEVEK